MYNSNGYTHDSDQFNQGHYQIQIWSNPLMLLLVALLWKNNNSKSESNLLIVLFKVSGNLLRYTHVNRATLSMYTVLSSTSTFGFNLKLFSSITGYHTSENNSFLDTDKEEVINDKAWAHVLFRETPG